MMASRKDEKAIFDVSKPGSTAPSSSSKPIIVSHKPIIKDSTLIENTEQKPSNSNPEVLKAPSEKVEVSKTVIMPLSDNESNSESDQDDTKESKKNQEKEPLSKSSKSTEKSQEETVVDAVISRAGDKKQKKLDEEELEAKKDRINNLVESKKYFVKVRQPKSKRKKRALLLVILLIIATFIGFVIAADAEVINVKVPVDFIKKQQPASNSLEQPNNEAKEEKATIDDVSEDINEVNRLTKVNDIERESDVKALASKAEEYYAQTGSYPADVSALLALIGLNKESSISPNNLPSIDGGNKLGVCTIEPSKEKNDHYCYIVTETKDQFQLRYFNETENLVKMIQGVNNNSFSPSSTGDTNL
jgi:hypothetical protein